MLLSPLSSSTSSSMTSRRRLQGSTERLPAGVRRELSAGGALPAPTFASAASNRTCKSPVSVSRSSRASRLLLAAAPRLSTSRSAAAALRSSLALASCFIMAATSAIPSALALADAWHSALSFFSCSSLSACNLRFSTSTWTRCLASVPAILSSKQSFSSFMTSCAALATTNKLLSVSISVVCCTSVSASCVKRAAMSCS
mmetsp:Transcript_106395/g.296040  ORF Transcript_106395/g.296040 Transcript_106395/m.296040 type:complete len:200 (+) Transcript_106395:1023-1622(+)